MGKVGPGIVATAVVAVLVVACGKEASRSKPPPRPSASASAAADPSAPPPRATPPPPAASGSAAVVVHAYDAGVNACRVVYGPAQQSFIGEVALVATDTGALLVTHHDGIPTVTRVVAGDAAAVPPTPTPSTTDAGYPHVTSPPCVIAGSFSFCMDPGGAIHRRALEGDGRDVVIARSRPGAPFAADLLDTSHIVLVYLAERQTTEGVVSQAYATLDEGPPVRLSDEGSGTTYVALARRGNQLVALLLDGRVAMTPTHVRTLTRDGTKLVATEDAVVFVGGEAEPSTRGVLGTDANGAAYALIPISGESGFGLASVRIDDPPRTDEPTTWSPYLNGLDPAPVAATHGVSPIRVARVRPLDARADGPRGLELGRLDDRGEFISYGLVGSKGRVTSAALAVDPAGPIWLAFTDGTGTWLEKRVCP